MGHRPAPLPIPREPSRIPGPEGYELPDPFDAAWPLACAVITFMAIAALFMIAGHLVAWGFGL